MVYTVKGKGEKLIFKHYKNAYVCAKALGIRVIWCRDADGTVFSSRVK